MMNKKEKKEVNFMDNINDLFNQIRELINKPTPKSIKLKEAMLKNDYKIIEEDKELNEELRQIAFDLYTKNRASKIYEVAFYKITFKSITMEENIYLKYILSKVDINSQEGIKKIFVYPIAVYTDNIIISEKYQNSDKFDFSNIIVPPYTVDKKFEEKIEMYTNFYSKLNEILFIKISNLLNEFIDFLNASIVFSDNLNNFFYRIEIIS